MGVYLLILKHHRDRETERERERERQELSYKQVVSLDYLRLTIFNFNDI